MTLMIMEATLIWQTAATQTHQSCVTQILHKIMEVLPTITLHLMMMDPFPQWLIAETSFLYQLIIEWQATKSIINWYTSCKLTIITTKDHAILTILSLQTTSWSIQPMRTTTRAAITVNQLLRPRLLQHSQLVHTQLQVLPPLLLHTLPRLLLQAQQLQCTIPRVMELLSLPRQLLTRLLRHLLLPQLLMSAILALHIRLK